VEGASSGRIETSLLAQKSLVLQLRAEELSRNVEGFTSDDYDLLAIEQLLSNSTGQATEKMSLAIDDDDWLKGRHPARILCYVVG
jgi:hypothetical protein